MDFCALNDVRIANIAAYFQNKYTNAPPSSGDASTTDTVTLSLSQFKCFIGMTSMTHTIRDTMHTIFHYNTIILHYNCPSGCSRWLRPVQPSFGSTSLSPGELEFFEIRVGCGSLGIVRKLKKLQNSIVSLALCLSRSPSLSLARSPSLALSHCKALVAYPFPRGPSASCLV